MPRPIPAILRDLITWASTRRNHPRDLVREGRDALTPAPRGRPKSVDREPIHALLAEGKSYAEISRETGVPESTVRAIAVGDR